MDDMEMKIPENGEETKAVPAVTSPAPRRRRTDRYRTDAPSGTEPAEPASAQRFTGTAASQSESATAREVARRFHMEEMDGSPRRPEGRSGSARQNALGGVRSFANRAGDPYSEGREQAGYAPGRMGGTARGRMSEESRARLAAESRKAGYGSRREEGPDKGAWSGEPREGRNAGFREERRRRGLVPAVLTALLLLIGAVLIVMLAVPEDAAGPLGVIRRTLRSGEKGTAQIRVFSADGAENTAPTDVTFTIATEGGAPVLRLVDESGSEIPVMAAEEGTAPNIRTLVWHLNSAWEGVVRLQILSGEEWQDTGNQTEIRVTEAKALPESVITPESVVFATEVPTEAPAMETATPAQETESPFEEDENADAEMEGTNESNAPAQAVPGVEAENAQNAANDVSDSAGRPEEAPDSSAAPQAAEPDGVGNGADAQPKEEIREETPEEAEQQETEPADETGEDGAAEEVWEELPDQLEDGMDEDDPDRFTQAENPADQEVPEEPGSAGEQPTESVPAGDADTAAVQPPDSRNGDAETASESGEMPERPKMIVTAAESASPSLIATTQIYNGTKKVKEYARASADQIQMPTLGEYTRQKMGILTFRTDAFRQNAAIGTAEGLGSLELAWTAEAGSAKGASGTMYYGSGWGSQPAIIKWSKEVRELSDLYESKKEKTGLREVIVAGQDGRIYFLDLTDGTATRNSIKLGYPMRATPSLHPSGAPYMTVGQLARKMARGTGSIGLRQYNLYNMKELSLIDGLDAKNNRPYNNIGSFETSALIDRKTGTLVTAGTNGMLYVIKLNSEFDYSAGVYTQSPAQVVLRTKAKKEKDADTAVEASVAMYDRYVYYADMGGYLRCVDTNSMTVAWAAALGDAVESTPALDWHGEDGLDLYTATELTAKKKGEAFIKCFDALSGEERWSVGVGVAKDAKSKTKAVAGFRASPVVGQNGLSDYVYYTVNLLSDEGREQLGISGNESSALIALRKEDGRIVWTQGLSGSGYSSPVAVYDENGDGVIIQCCGDGTILMLDGKTGDERDTLEIDGAIEASPAVYNNMMVIATSEKNKNNIYGIRIQ